MDLIKEMEEYAKVNDVPIMQDTGLTFMLEFIKNHQIKRILEVGSAIGYSAIRMASINEDIEIVTIERDDLRYQKALEFINRSGIGNQINLIHGDALETVVEGEFDLLFIDAAKAQYRKFFERYELNLKQGGYIITDNLAFHGFVDHPEKKMSRNLRQLVRKIKGFRDYLPTRTDYDTKYYEIGDGVAVSQKK